MKDVHLLTEFIENAFDRYHCDTVWLYADQDDDSGEIIEHPLFPDGVAAEEILKKVSDHLGMTKEEILSMDQNAAYRYWNKYPFFSLYQEYLNIWSWHMRFPVDEQRSFDQVMSIIMNGADEPAALRDFNPEDLKARLVAQLKEIDTVMPGTFHKNAEITNLSVHTEVFFSFKECGKMVSSFLDMLDRTKELFFKALKEDLSDVEVQELNFLACWLNATDAVMPSVVITYDAIRTYREVYRKENLSDFSSYVKFRRFDYKVVDYRKGFIPWRCKEFFDDMSLVQRYVNAFPETKAILREFAMAASYFDCDFIWSDAKPIVFPAEEEQEFKEYLQVLGEEDIPLEKRAKEHTRIYVKKTAEELFDWAGQIEKLNKAVSPVAQGGLRVPPRQIELTSGVGAIERLQARIAAKHEGRH